MLKSIHRKRELLFIIAALGLYLCRYALCSFEYYSLLDDHIQYYWYSQMGDTFQNVFLRIGTISTRPLAGVFDVYVWSPLYIYAPWSILFITAVLNVLGVYFIKLALEDMDIYTGGVFYLVLLLMPLGFEAQYWLSASSRVIVGVFFTGASLLVLRQYRKKRRWYTFVLFCLLQLASYCFYEQTAILSFILCCAYIYKTKQKKTIYLVPVVNGCIIGIYYILMRNVGALSGRMSSMAIGELWPHIVFMAKEIYHVLCMGIFTLNVTDFVRGLALLLENPWLMALIAVISGVFAWLSGREKHNSWFSFFLGAAVAVFSVVLLFITKDATMPFRVAYIPMLGAALMIGFLLSKLHFHKSAAFITVFLAAFCFSVCNVSEMCDYREAAMIDKTICENIISALDDDTLSGERECYVIGAKRSYADGIVLHREHIINAVSSDWALTGAVRHYLKGNGIVKMVIPASEITPEIQNSGAQILFLNEDYTVTKMEEK